MGLDLISTGYFMCERMKVTIPAASTTAISLMSIPKGTYITDVLVKIVSAGVGTGDIDIGDDDDPAGYLDGCDATGAANTIYGDDPTERGAYLYDGTKKSLPGKFYTGDKTLKAVASASTLTTGVTADVYVMGFRAQA